MISGWPLPAACALSSLLAIASPICAPARAAPPPAPPVPVSPVLINEVLYDPAGPDAGGEFVELVLATGAAPIDLGRLRLERGNGQRPGDWKLVWQGTAGDTLSAARHYVVGGAAVTPPPAARAELELQNGPDACRLLLDGQVTDVVGWGELQAGEFFLGEPAADVSAGSSLGRVPDGRSTGRNRSDFLALPGPSPGRANRRPPAVKVKSRHHSRADPAPSLLIEVALEASAAELPALATAPVEVTAFVPSVPAASARASFQLAEGKAAGTLTLAPLPIGPITIGLIAAAAIAREGEAVAPDTSFFAARVGPGPLLVNEFLFRPRPGEPEWIELIHPGPDTLATSGYAVSDEHGEAVPLSGAPPLAPGSLLVIASAPIAAVPSALVLGAAWPHLNDSGGPPADRILLADPEGRTSDCVAYGGDWAAAGVSVERLSIQIDSEARSAWSAAPDGASPGRPNGAARELAPLAGYFALDPALVRAGSRTEVLFRLAEPLRTGAITVHAADGRLVRRLTSAELRGQRTVRFAARDADGVALPMGCYLVSVAGEADRSGRASEPSAAPVTARATLVVVP